MPPYVTPEHGACNPGAPIKHGWALWRVCVSASAKHTCQPGCFWLTSWGFFGGGAVFCKHLTEWVGLPEGWVKNSSLGLAGRGFLDGHGVQNGAYLAHPPCHRYHLCDSWVVEPAAYQARPRSLWCVSQQTQCTHVIPFALAHKLGMLFRQSAPMGMRMDLFLQGLF